VVIHNFDVVRIAVFPAEADSPFEDLWHDGCVGLHLAVDRQIETLGADEVNRAARGERSPCPPDMPHADVPVMDALLAPRRIGDALDKQVNFDETFGVGGHYCFIQDKPRVLTIGSILWYSIFASG
jgi:hypothetical protein